MAFDMFKEQLSSATTLEYLKFDDLLIIETDTSFN